MISSNPIKILLIDDEPDICQAWSMLLEMEGMEVITAQNGQQGLLKAQSFLPTVVLCDFMMPMMNGLEVCRAIKAQPRLRDVPFILWSAARDIENDGIADIVVAKPIHIEVLLGHIRAALDIRH
jgi:CheY-like chemotaxis protein